MRGFPGPAPAGSLLLYLGRMTNKLEHEAG
jgi:hypothetical protein